MKTIQYQMEGFSVVTTGFDEDGIPITQKRPAPCTVNRPYSEENMILARAEACSGIDVLDNEEPESGTSGIQVEGV